MVERSGRSFMVDPLSYLSFQPVFYDWYNKGRDMCYPVCGGDVYKIAVAHIRVHITSNKD